MKHIFDIEMTCSLTLEIDDEITSEHYLGETVLTGYLNRERFIEGATLEDALQTVAVQVGVEGRRLSRVDGWADFPDGAVRVVEGWPEWQMIHASERTPNSL